MLCRVESPLEVPQFPLSTEPLIKVTETDLVLWRFRGCKGSGESLFKDLDRVNSLGGERERRVGDKGIS